MKITQEEKELCLLFSKTSPNVVATFADRDSNPLALPDRPLINAGIEIATIGRMTAGELSVCDALAFGAKASVRNNPSNRSVNRIGRGDEPLASATRLLVMVERMAGSCFPVLPRMKQKSFAEFDFSVERATCTVRRAFTDRLGAPRPVAGSSRVDV